MTGICEERALRRAQTGRGAPKPEQAQLREAWLLTWDSPGWLGPIVLWGRPSNQEIFRGLSTRPTSFWTASSCQIQHPVLVPSLQSATKWLSLPPQKEPEPALSSSKQSTANFIQWCAEALTFLVRHVSFLTGEWGKGRRQCEGSNLEACWLPGEGGGCGARQQEMKPSPEYSPVHPFTRCASTPGSWRGSGKSWL